MTEALTYQLIDQRYQRVQILLNRQVKLVSIFEVHRDCRYRQRAFSRMKITTSFLILLVAMSCPQRGLGEYQAWYKVTDIPSSSEPTSSIVRSRPPAFCTSDSTDSEPA